jgi:hypothetical protein
MIRGGGETA